MEVATVPTYAKHLANVRLSHIEAWACYLTMKENGWNKAASARELGISVRNLQNKVLVLKKKGWDIPKRIEKNKIVSP